MFVAQEGFNMVQLRRHVLFIGLKSQFQKLSYCLLLSLAAMVGMPAAKAQFVYPPAVLFGGGDVIGPSALRQVLDCEGQKRPLLFQAAGVSGVADFIFPGLGAAVPAFNCLTQVVQPNLRGWFQVTNAPPVLSFGQNNAALLGPFPNGLSEVDVPFQNLHFSMTSSPGFDLSGFQFSAGGLPVQFPVYVVPIAVSYDPVYAKVATTAGILEYTFMINPAFSRPDGSGGLRLDKSAYCNIFNPASVNPITNWNDARLRILNGGISLQDVREAMAGVPFDVPIRLVGRQDTSAATVIWSRHLAAACGAPPANSFAAGAPQLPPSIIGAAVFNTAGITGQEQQGRYLVAKGSSGVAAALDYNPAPLIIGARALNGKIGYMEPDAVLPAVRHSNLNNYFLATASLGQGAKFAAPTPANATLAFGILVPPESKPTGAYDPSVTVNGKRSDPHDWVQPADKAAALAFPDKGYPVVGSANALLYTCYADPNVRQGISHFMSLFLDTVKKDGSSSVFSTKLVSDASSGILGRNGFGTLPAAWKSAIANTFFANSPQPGVYAEKQPLRFVATGSRTAILAPVMAGSQRMFRQRTAHALAKDVSEIRIGLMNWFDNGIEETALGNDVMYKAVWIERASTQETRPVTFGAARAVTLEAGTSATHTLSDPILAAAWSTPLTAGELFWVHMVGQVPNLTGQRILDGGPSGYSGSAHKRYPLADNAGLGIDYAGPVPAIPGFDVSFNTGVPVLFVGRTTVCCSRAVAVVGDSISQGAGDGGLTTLIAGKGYAARSSVNAAGQSPLAIAVFARSGESAADFLGSNNRRLALMNYADIAHVAYGTNDIGTGPGSVLSVQNNRLRTLRALIRSTVPSIQAVTAMTLLQRTTSVDLFATLAGQTPVSSDWGSGGVRDQLNNAILADRNLPANNPARLDAAFDIGPSVLAPNDQTRWNADGFPRTWVQDGVHPSGLGHSKIADITRAGWLSIPLATTPTAQANTLGQRNLWIQAGLPLSATSILPANPKCGGLAGVP
jgi:lysophospholipase L1-like esterase